MSLTLTFKQLVGVQVSDEDLMLKFTETSDKRWLAKLYDNCADDLYHFISTQSDRTLAKDVCQKTWLKVIEKRHLYGRSGRFKAWLFTMGRNVLIDEFRASQKFTSELEQGSERASEHFQADNLRQTFDVALDHLPFKQREAFCLQQEGFGLQEIANITHSNVETVKSRLRYAKNSLRQKLENYHE